MKAITCFLPYIDAAQATPTIEALKAEHTIGRICLLAGQDADTADVPEGCDIIAITEGLNASSTIRAIAEAAATPYILLYTKHNKLVPGYHALERMLRIAADSRAGMLYADSYAVAPDGKRTAAPVIDYQEGSLRDDFNFGSLMLFDTEAFKEAAAGMSKDYKAAGLYDLRLRLSRIAPIVHINEYLYTDVQLDTRRSGEKIFDYVDPKNRGVQIEMEQACTDHLKAVGAYLEPKFDKIEFGAEEFPVEATVVIPVRNRVRTIRDAINSVLSQQTDFPFNLIVVDNHSTDGTTEAIDEFTDPRVIHIIPEREDLGIGGCWNMAVDDPRCGKFAVQLDSDDVYSGTDTLQKIVNAFYEQNCGMVVGTYCLTDIDMNTIPPGVIAPQASS